MTWFGFDLMPVLRLIPRQLSYATDCFVLWCLKSRLPGIISRVHGWSLKALIIGETKKDPTPSAPGDEALMFLANCTSLRRV